MGDAILADPALTLEVLLLQGRGVRPRRARPAVASRATPRSRTRSARPSAAASLAEVWPEDGILVLESPSSTLAMRSRLKLSKPGLVLLRRRRRPGLRPVRRGRRAARPAGPPGRLRDRRGLGAVRGHRLLDRGRLRRPAEGARAAQRGVRDPQVVRARSSPSPARPASTCRRSSRPRSRRATA